MGTRVEAVAVLPASPSIGPSTTAIGGDPATTAEQHGWVRLAERLAMACQTR